jgi:hypothetical protein
VFDVRKSFALIVVSLFLFTACAGNESANVNAAAPEAAEQTQPAADTSGTQPQPPDNVKMIYGEISEVIGNAVTVKLVETPEPGRRFETQLDEDGNPVERQLPEGVVVGEDGQIDFSQMELPEGVTLDENGRPDFSQMQNGEGMPEGFAMGDGEGMPEGFTMGDGEGMRGQRQFGENGEGTARELNYTGEEIDIIIPVGIPVTTSTVGEDGIETDEIQLDDISAGDMITVTYKEDGTTIDTVTITEAGTVGGMGMMPGGGMPGDMGFFINGGGPGGGSFEVAMPAP